MVYESLPTLEGQGPKKAKKAKRTRPVHSMKAMYCSKYITIESSKMLDKKRRKSRTAFTY